MAPRATRVAVIALLGLGGCGTADTLLHRSGTRSTPAGSNTVTATPTTKTASGPSAESVYLAELGSEQARLAAAEARIPTSPRTPAALARSIELLTVAVRDLADGLARIKPPPSVAALHAHLVAIMRTYEVELRRAASVALSPGGEPRAGSLLISATNQASPWSGPARNATLKR